MSIYEKAMVELIVENDMKKFIESCLKINYENYSSDEVRQAIIGDIILNMHLDKKTDFNSVLHIERWIEKCKTELRNKNGNISWFQKRAYQNIMAFDESFRNEIHKYYEI